MKSSIDFGNIVLGKLYVEGCGTSEYESAREVEYMRLQILAGKRLKRQAERKRIRLEREARTRVQFEPLKEKRAEEYAAQKQMDSQRQYDQHLERHRLDKLRKKGTAQQENRRDPEEYQRALEAGRQADVAAGMRLRSGSYEQGLTESWQRLEDMTSEEGAFLRPSDFQVQERDGGQIALTITGEMDEDLLGWVSEQQLIAAQQLQESGEMEGLEGDFLEGGHAPESSAQALRRVQTEPDFVRAGVLAEQVQGWGQGRGQRWRP